jgi:cyclohexa-1,5-dienecarbonyl-CoA hydratase
MSDNYQSIRFNIEDRIGRITFARPPLNIFNISMMREINDAVNEAAARRDVVGLVFEADREARAFSAGVAIEEHVEETIYQMLDSFHGIFRALEQASKPVIAVVDGAALGGGCELVAACDIVISTERARFGQPEIKLGVFPPIAAVLLPRIIGDKRARELILTGEMIDAAEALRLGLVNAVVPRAELWQKTEEVLVKLRELSAPALEATKRAIDLARNTSFEDGLRRVEDLYLNELMKTEDAHEGINAFMQKRKPAWKNK